MCDLFDGAAHSDPTDVQVAKVWKLLVFLSSLLSFCQPASFPAAGCW